MKIGVPPHPGFVEEIAVRFAALSQRSEETLSEIGIVRSDVPRVAAFDAMG